MDVAAAGLPNQERVTLTTPQPRRELLEALIANRLMADAARKAALEREERVRAAVAQAGDSDVARDAALAAAYLADQPHRQPPPASAGCPPVRSPT